MGRTGHPALLLGTAAVVVAAVGTSVALTRQDVPVAKAATTLSAVHHASLVSPSGSVTAARDGQRVPNGYVVRTSRGGTADLVTRGRVVHVGDGRTSAAVAVVNGAHQQLRTGSAVVDAQHGPGLTMDVAGDVLTVPDHSATEATRSVSVLVGSLVGPAALTNSSARALTISALYQVEVSGDALPTRSTPLYLTDSAAEHAVAPTLVDADLSLQELARGIDQGGPGTSSVIEASWSHPTLPLPAGTPRSEHVMPIVIADSTNGDSASDGAQTRYNQVLTWRGQGGSWAVVVGLLHGSANAVAKQLNGYVNTQPTSHFTTASLQNFVAPHAPHPGHSSSPNPHPTHTTTPTKPPTKPTHMPKPKPTTTTPVQKVVGTVNTVVKKVVGLLPTIKPVTTKSGSPGLLGGLLGH
jgi:hypothetical protein